jgi:hypothetical protein
VTVGPGSTPNTWYGHTALLVDDGTPNGARIFGYGLIPLGVRSAFGAVAGRIIATTSSRNARLELERLTRTGRSVRIQDLRLAPRATARLVALLYAQTGTLPLTYAYDALADNCSTRIRDLINEATDGKLRLALAVHASALSLRDAGRAAIAAHPFFTIATDFMVGSAADALISEWEAGAFPVQLADALSHVSLADEQGDLRAFAIDRYAVVAPAAPAFGSAALILIAGTFAGGFAIFIACFLRRNVRASQRVFGVTSALFGIALGVPGVMLALAGNVTAHATIAHNANIFFANPLTFAALPLGIACLRGHERAATWLRRLWFALAGIALAGVITSTLPSFTQDNARTIALLFPLVAGGALAAAVALPAPSAGRVYHLQPRS